MSISQVGSAAGSFASASFNSSASASGTLALSAPDASDVQQEESMLGSAAVVSLAVLGVISPDMESGAQVTFDSFAYQADASAVSTVMQQNGLTAATYSSAQQAEFVGQGSIVLPGGMEYGFMLVADFDQSQQAAAVSDAGSSASDQLQMSNVPLDSAAALPLMSNPVTAAALAATDGSIDTAANTQSAAAVPSANSSATSAAASPANSATGPSTVSGTDLQAEPLDAVDWNNIFSQSQDLLTFLELSADTQILAQAPNGADGNSAALSSHTHPVNPAALILQVEGSSQSSTTISTSAAAATSTSSSATAATPTAASAG